MFYNSEEVISDQFNHQILIQNLEKIDISIGVVVVVFVVVVFVVVVVVVGVLVVVVIAIVAANDKFVSWHTSK